MIGIWNKISYAGIKEGSYIQNRNVVLTNRIALVIFILALSIAWVFNFFFGKPTSPTLAVIVALLMIPVWVLNNYGLKNISRLFISFLLPVAIISISIAAKIRDSNFNDVFEYYDSRFLLLAISTLPFILFEFRESIMLSVSSLFNALVLILFDPIHQLFNVGYEQVGHDATYYNYIDYVVIISYFTIALGIVILKSIIHKTENDNLLLINGLKEREDQLKESNKNLKKLNEEISQRNKSIHEQAEELKTKHEQIFNASQIIANQRKELETKNQMLEMKLRSQDKSLLEINTELVKRNNELRQFGYTVSHNLRGPIASLLGLANLFSKENESSKNVEIINHMTEVTINLDTIIKDLNHIVEIRKDTQIEAEPIDLMKELNVVLSTMKERINKIDPKFVYDLKAKKIEGIKAYVHSIFFNLLDNSLKFRAHDRPLEIKINTYSKNGHVMMKFHDNGVGFDIDKHQNELFSLYKRFHSNAPGRGLGLYLTKLQVETLGGEIFVNSEKDYGTTFTISFPRPQDD